MDFSGICSTNWEPNVCIAAGYFLPSFLQESAQLTSWDWDAGGGPAEGGCPLSVLPGSLFLFLHTLHTLLLRSLEMLRRERADTSCHSYILEFSYRIYFGSARWFVAKLLSVVSLDNLTLLVLFWTLTYATSLWRVSNVTFWLRMRTLFMEGL